MKFYEMTREAGNDYYALIVASNIEEPKNVYIEAYKIDEDKPEEPLSVNEISYEEVLERLEHAKTEDGDDLSDQDIEADLKSPSSGVLLIDRAVL